MARFSPMVGFQIQELRQSATWDTCADRDQQQQSSPLTLEEAYKRAVAAPSPHCTMLFEQQSTAGGREQPSTADRALLRQRNLKNSSDTHFITGDNGNSQELNRLLSDCLAEMGCVPVADYISSSKATVQHGYSQTKPLQQQQLPPGSRATGVAPPVRSAAGGSNISGHAHTGVISPAVHQQVQPSGLVTSRVQTGFSDDVVAARDTADASTPYSKELLQALQQDVEWQAQQLRLKEQQLNEMIQQHELLLRKYLEVKAANKALLQQQSVQPAWERRRSDSSGSSSPQVQQQWQWTPLSTPRAGMSLLTSAYPTPVQPAAPGEYLPVLISQGGTVPMSPSPPPLSDKNNHPAPRRHHVCNSLQQFGPADAAATNIVNTAAAVGTPGRTAFMALSSVPVAGIRTGIATAAGVADSSPAAASTASPTTAFLNSVPDVAAVFIQRPSKSQSQVCLMEPECGIRPAPAVYSSRAADALVSPRVGLRIRSLPASSSVARHPTVVTGGEVSKLVPMPPTELPSHIAAESRRAGRLPEPLPGRVSECSRPT